MTRTYYVRKGLDPISEGLDDADRIQFQCPPSEAAGRLPYVPKHITSICLESPINDLDQAGLITFVRRIPRHVKCVRFECKGEVTDTFVRALAMCAPGVEEVQLDGTYGTTWTMDVLRKLDDQPWFGFMHLCVDLMTVGDGKYVTRLLSRLKRLTLEGGADKNQKQVHEEIAAALSSPSCTLEAYTCDTHPIILPEKLIPTMREIRFHNHFIRVMHMVGEKIYEFLRGCAGNSHHLHTLDLDIPYWDDEDDINKTCAAIAMMIHGLKKLHFTRRVSRKGFEIYLEMLRWPECLLLDFRCSINTGDVLELLQAVRRDTRIRTFKFAIQESENIDMTPQVLKERILDIRKRFMDGLGSEWFHVLQSILSVRIVGRLHRGHTLLAEVPWSDHVHSISAALGWTIGDLYVPMDECLTAPERPSRCTNQ